VKKKYRIITLSSIFSFLALGALIALYGCVTPSGTDCDSPIQAGQDLKCREGNRSYYLYASKNYDASQPTALIVDAHGAQSNAEQEAGLVDDYCAGDICLGGGGSGWRLEADMPGNNFVVLTPQGEQERWLPSDRNFIMDAVAHAKTIANVDKVFMSGVSNGGLLSYWTGCPNAGEFDGLAPIVGGSSCSSISEPMPVISFDAQPDFAYITTQSASDKMVDLNNCRTGPVPYLTIDRNYDEPVCRDDAFGPDPKLVPCSSISPAIEPTICKKWTNCDGGVEVVFCDVAPNHKPGEAATALEAHILVANSTHLNLPSIAWRFFKEQYINGDDDSDDGNDNGNDGWFPIGCN